MEQQMTETVKTIRVVVIDPKQRTVTERQIAPTLQSLQQIVGGSIELVRFSDCDCNVNENGHYLAEKHTFIYTDPKHGPTVPLIGTAVLFGELTRGGRETSLKLPLDAVRERVRFPSPTAN
jgi:hypothetical protein